MPPQDDGKPGSYCHVRVLNLVEEGMRLDVFLGGIMLTNDVPYKHHGPYVKLKAMTMTAAAFFAHTNFRLYGLHRFTTQGDKAYTMIITGNARKGNMWLVEDAQQDRPRTIRLVNAAQGVRRATLTVLGKRPMLAAYGEATPYVLWPPQDSNVVLRAQYANEIMRVRVPERLLHTMGAHSVYLAGPLPTPPEALVLRDGPEY
ncbi:MAG: DUF4397 domain-containing protein [Bacillota bacterium]